MFSKLLIANRGEIACRIMRTAHRLGISTVAVYSDADVNALHVSLADEAVHIGTAPPRDSYLQGQRIVDAARRTGAQAVHPGYGFLSENAAFCKHCAEAGLVFVGPTPSAIEAMGSKAAAKRIMAEAGVPTLPGYHGDDQAADLLLAQAEVIGFPVLLKAVSGGGGKGMRLVEDAARFHDELAAARREAESSFADSRMLVEKYLAQPRHVEVQIFCDQHGNGVYLAERDCSLQRRHQKVIEEAPAPGLSDGLRQAMGEAALRAAQAIDYIGAGTVEFLLDAAGDFYFMEMNTRLQVEHPVTEMISGQDLVEWQLRVAAGETLPAAQSELSIQGHAFEARIYAEDPAKDFLPTTGTLHVLQSPPESQHVRVDTGVRQRDTVSVHYDPMIAKLITWDTDRRSALRRLAAALSEFHVAGLSTNIDFLYNIATHDAFANAQLSTGFIERHAHGLLQSTVTATGDALALAGLYLMLSRQLANQNAAQGHPDIHSPWHQHSGWRMNEPHVHTLIIDYDGEHHALTLTQRDAKYFEMHWGEERFSITGELEQQRLIADINGFRQRVTVASHDGMFSVYGPSGAFAFATVEPDRGHETGLALAGNPRAPMNGVIVKLLVEPGDAIEQDAALLVMEAMKMEHTIRAPAAGRVTSFYVQPGDLVDGDAELLDFEAAPE
ncbi:MAG: acetyl/propionyl/methylcrotonyl-CoA carboxylase subunit alpha [Pseudomonadota bacterium]